MKKKTSTIMKAFFLVLLCSLLISVMSFSVFADGTALQTDDVSTDTEKSNEADTVVKGNETADTSLFSLMYGTVMNYTSEIFCALACVCSLVLALAYKKGLLPLIRNALSGIGGAVGKLKEQTEATLNGSDGALKQVYLSLDKAESTAKALSEKVTLLDSKLSELERSGETVRVTEYLMSTQIDMLYELFMASGIPQFQKEAVAEKVKAMKEAISTDGNEKQ